MHCFTQPVNKPAHDSYSHLSDTNRTDRTHTAWCRRRIFTNYSV